MSISQNLHKGPYLRELVDGATQDRAYDLGAVVGLAMVVEADKVTH